MLLAHVSGMPCVGDVTFLYSCLFWAVSEDLTAPWWLIQLLVADSLCTVSTGLTLTQGERLQA